MANSKGLTNISVWCLFNKNEIAEGLPLIILLFKYIDINTLTICGTKTLPGLKN